MGPSKPFAFALALATLALGCMHHDAQVRTASLPTPSASPVQHSGRLWVELGDATWEYQCRAPKGQRELCFSGVRRAAAAALSRSVWNSFPEIVVRDGERIPAGDYLLKLDVTLDALPPDQAERTGWSAVATGAFELSRDGRVLRRERLGSRSRSDFAYGSALGVAAGEVVDAFAVHVGQVLASIPEDRPFQPTALPAVVAEVMTPAAPAAGAPRPSDVTPPVEAPTAPPLAPEQDEMVPEPAASPEPALPVPVAVR